MEGSSYLELAVRKLQTGFGKGIRPKTEGRGGVGFEMIKS